MEKEFYYVYCKGILGVKTNIKNFKWIYGSVAPETSRKEFESCQVKFIITEKSENDLFKIPGDTLRFQMYYWNEDKEILYYRRKLLGKIVVGYDISFFSDVIDVNIGRNYLSLIKQRIMNLHGMYYLLADIANIMLMKKGYLTLYASAIYSSSNERGIVFFAPPNTGKTSIATKLCCFPDNSLVGEDIVITNGEKLFGCPWTASYRINKSSGDDGGAFGRVPRVGEFKVCESCVLTDFVLLSKGNNQVIEDKEEVIRKISIVNGYLFLYNSAPIVKIIGYFKKQYDISWNTSSHKMFEDISNRIYCIGIQSENPTDYEKFMQGHFWGKKYENFSDY